MERKLDFFNICNFFRFVNERTVWAEQSEELVRFIVLPISKTILFLHNFGLMKIFECMCFIRRCVTNQQKPFFKVSNIVGINLLLTDALNLVKVSFRLLNNSGVMMRFFKLSTNYDVVKLDFIKKYWCVSK